MQKLFAVTRPTQKKNPLIKNFVAIQEILFILFHVHKLIYVRINFLSKMPLILCLEFAVVNMCM